MSHCLASQGRLGHSAANSTRQNSLKRLTSGVTSRRRPGLLAVAQDVLQRPTVDMEERMAFLAEDLTLHLFGGQGIDKSQYDEVVDFCDPITKYSNAQGYMFNISMLKKVFNPKFFLHAIKQTGEYEATTRWTMLMRPTFIPSPLQGLWDPTLVFTGTSVMGVNPKNGKFNSHVDYWDSVEDNTYFSVEALGNVLMQISIIGNATPSGARLPFDMLLKAADWEVRRYKPFHAVVADSGADSEQLEAVEAYLAGENVAQRALPRVSPLFQANRRAGGGSCVVAPLEEEPSGKALSAFPPPHDRWLRLVTVPPQVFIASFSREASSSESDKVFRERVGVAFERLEGKGGPIEFKILSGGWERSEFDDLQLRELQGCGNRPKPKWADLRSIDLSSLLQ